MNLQDIFRSKKFRIAAIVLGSIVVILLSFRAGMIVGFHKASFSYDWDERYQHMFVPGKQFGSRDMFRREDLAEAHGVVGVVMKVGATTIIVMGTDGLEREVLVNDQTLIRSFRSTIKLADLKIGDRVAIVGSPDKQARIEAKLIRIFPDIATTTIPVIK